MARRKILDRGWWRCRNSWIMVFNLQPNFVITSRGWSKSIYLFLFTSSKAAGVAKWIVPTSLVVCPCKLSTAALRSDVGGDFYFWLILMHILKQIGLILRNVWQTDASFVINGILVFHNRSCYLFFLCWAMVLIENKVKIEVSTNTTQSTF